MTTLANHKTLLSLATSWILVVLGLPHLVSAETIIYSDGQDRIAPIELAEDAFLSIDTGSAIQSGAISEMDGSFGITKTGAGTLVMGSDGNTYTGATIVQEGSLVQGLAYAIQYTAVTINTGATFDLGGFGTELNGLSGGGTLDFGGGYFYLYSGGTFSGELSGGGTLIYESADTFILNGNSEFLGDLNIGSSGRIVSSGSSSFGGLSIFNGEFEVDGGSTTVDSYVYVSAADQARLTVTGGGFLEITDFVYAGAYPGEGGEIVVSGEASHLKVGELYLSDEGTGTLTVSSGTVTVNNGNGSVELDTSAGGSGTLFIGAASGEEPEAPGIVNASRVHTEGGSGLLIFNHNGAGYHFTKDGTSAGAAVRITGATEVLVESGVTTLTGSNTYTGGTTIMGGTLIISDLGNGASVLGTGAVQVDENGRLGGAGTVFGDTTVAGALAPGPSVGMMHFDGTLFLEGTAVIEMELAAMDSFDGISVGNTLTYDGELKILLQAGYRPDAGQTFHLFDAAFVTLGSQFDAITFDVVGYAGELNYATGELTITAVPEPSVAVLIVAGGALIAGRRRRRGGDLFRSGKSLDPSNSECSTSES
jgi:autotransporter-associated beta strand protein/T5SS/PEP-CTERM-associated repeat protein